MLKITNKANNLGMLIIAIIQPNISTKTVFVKGRQKFTIK